MTYDTVDAAFCVELQSCMLVSKIDSKGITPLWFLAWERVAWQAVVLEGVRSHLSTCRVQVMMMFLQRRHSSAHDLISMTLMNGRFLLLCVDGFRGLLWKRGRQNDGMHFICMELICAGACMCVTCRQSEDWNLTKGRNLTFDHSGNSPPDHAALCSV